MWSLTLVRKRRKELAFFWRVLVNTPFMTTYSQALGILLEKYTSFCKSNLTYNTTLKKEVHAFPFYR